MPKYVKRSLSDQLREIIANRGTAYAVAKAAGLDPGVVSRFLSHERGLTTQSLDKLAEALGLRLVETGRPARRPPAGSPRKATPRKATGAPKRADPGPSTP